MRGNGTDEIGVEHKSGKVLIKIDPGYFRPTEVDLLLGDSSKAYNLLGWQHKTSFPELVKEMVREDLARICHTV